MTAPSAESADWRCESTTYPIAAEHPIVVPSDRILNSMSVRKTNNIINELVTKVYHAEEKYWSDPWVQKVR